MHIVLTSLSPVNIRYKFKGQSLHIQLRDDRFRVEWRETTTCIAILEKSNTSAT